MDEERDYPINWQEKTGRRRGETLIIANSGQIKSHRFDYQWRPAELGAMCLYDFVQFAEKVQRNASAIPDVDDFRRYDFLPGHPQAATHCIRLRQWEQRTLPSFIGPLVPST